jgi:hypothetical protein
MKGATEDEQEKKEKYAAHEKLTILAVCGLYKNEWEYIPPIYSKFCVVDGRMLPAVPATRNIGWR